MSTLDEKLANPELAPGTTAKATLTQLQKRWSVGGNELDPKKPPQLVLITGMRRETWRLLKPDGGSSMYELIEVRP